MTTAVRLKGSNAGPGELQRQQKRADQDPLNVNDAVFRLTVEGPSQTLSPVIQFVRPFIAGFPENRHVTKNIILEKDVVVEWSFEADHSWPFAGRQQPARP